MKKVKLLSFVLALVLAALPALPSCGNADGDDFSYIPETFGCQYPTTISERETALDDLSALSANSKKQLFDRYADSRYTTFVFRSSDQLISYAESYAAYRSDKMADFSAVADVSYERYYNEFMDRYGDFDFSEAVLILASIPSPSSSRNYSVSHIETSGRKFIIHVAEHRPAVDTLETAMAAHLTLEMVVPVEIAEKIKHFDTVKSYETYGLFYHTPNSIDYTSLILLDEDKYVLQSPDGRICGSFENTSDRLTLYHEEQNKKYVFEYTTASGIESNLGIRLTDEGDPKNDIVPTHFGYYDSPRTDAVGQPLALVDSPDIPQTFGSPYSTSFSGNNNSYGAPLMGESSAVPKQANSLPTYLIKSKEQLHSVLKEEAEELAQRQTDPEIDRDTYAQQQLLRLVLKYGHYSFENYYILLCGGTTSKNGYKFSVSHIDTSDGGFTVYITKHPQLPYGGYAHVIGNWHMMMLVPAEMIDNATYVNTRMTDYSYGACSEKTDSDYPAYLLFFEDSTFLMYTGGEAGRRIRGSYRYAYRPDGVILTDGDTGQTYFFRSDDATLQLTECSSAEPPIPIDTTFVFSWYPPEPYLDQNSIVEPM